MAIQEVIFWREPLLLHLGGPLIAVDKVLLKKERERERENLHFDILWLSHLNHDHKTQINNSCNS